MSLFKTVCAVLLSAAGFAGCATSKSAEAEAPAAAEAPPPPPRPFDPAYYAEAFEQPGACEEGARQLLSQSRENAWAVLKICMARPNFKRLHEVVSEAWLPELRAKPEVPILLATLIARRGGSVERDEAELHQARIPLFSLSAAMEQPDTYKGKFVLFRGKASELKNKGGAVTVALTETTMSGGEHKIQEGLQYESSSSSAGQGQVSVKSSHYGNASAQGSYSDTRDHSSGYTSKRFMNESRETGREALGRLAKPDPFLVPEKEFIFLARFDGVRVTSATEADADPVKKAILTVHSYYEPAAEQVF